MMDATQPVSEWVAENFARAEVFEKLGIDYCCGGFRPLAEVCAEKNLDLAQVLLRLEELETKADELDPKRLSPSELCDQIEKTHHRYLKEKLPFIQLLLKKVVAAHGEEYSPLQLRFDRFAQELATHMENEEKELFPAIREHQTLKEQFRVFEDEHESAGKDLDFFRKFTNNYAIPEHACMTHRTLLLELEALEKDMHIHVYKENYLLFTPK